MRRRTFIGGFTALLAYSAKAQAPNKPVLIGVLSGGSPPDTEKLRRSFELGLRDLGYLAGRHYIVEVRNAEAVASRFPLLAQELVSLRPEVMVISNSSVILPVRQITAGIPIVSPLLNDPVGLGLIASHAHPGSNVTGIMGPIEEGLIGKQLAFAGELVPGAKIGLLANSRNAVHDVQRKGAESAAATLSVELASEDVQSPDEIDGAIRRLAATSVGVVLVLGDFMLFAERRRIVTAALAARLPTMFSLRDNVEVGGLMSYGLDLKENWRQAARYVDRVLKGEKPANIPVELPTKFELVINLKTTKALGLTIPDAILFSADEVIE